jgi:hypothetical protein
MFQNSHFPLRTIVGDAVPIGKASNIRQVFESAESKDHDFEYDFSLKSSITEMVEDPRYSRFFPSFTIDNRIIRPGEGMDSLPLPISPRPFDDSAQVISFFALSKKKVTTDVSRKLAARFSIKLPEKFLVSGICFGGFPYLPYSNLKIKSTGDNSSNFGLPREIRLTCLGGSSDKKDSSAFPEFLDAEISVTRQEIVSHSGFHYLCIDPTLTDSLTIHISDYPTILKTVTFDSQTNDYLEEEHYGFVIPYFYIFEYKEKTRYRPTVSAGLLGTNMNNGIPGIRDVFNECVDYRHVVSGVNAGNYFDFSAASIFGQQRSYTIREELFDDKKPKGKIKERLKECFISQKIEPRKNVVLYVEQGEEYERCIAGLKIFLPFIPDISLKRDVEKISKEIREFFPNSTDFSALIANLPRTDLEVALRQFLKIPKDIDFCKKIGISVYELDPLDGLSPMKVELDGKYATLLAEQQIDELFEISLALFLEGIRFFRSSSSRYFAIELTNLDKKAGQFVIKGLKLIQSAHVSVHARAAKTQLVRNLHFRIIGANLAEDYALLGDEGFNFSIERMVAGDRKDVLFRANSLMDLLHTGAAKIFSNARRRAVEFEKTEYSPQIRSLMNENGEDFEQRYSESSSTGWRSSETGKDVSLDGENAFQENPHINISPSTRFESYGNQESRLHAESLFPRNEGRWRFLRNYFSLLADINGDRFIQPRDVLISPNNLHHHWLQKQWKGFEAAELAIHGTNSVSTSPFTSLQGIHDLIDAGNNIANPADLAAFTANLTKVLVFNPFVLLTGGQSASVSISPFGLGFSLGTQPFPHLASSTTYGSSGNISKQAFEAKYSFSQFLNKGGDASEARTVMTEGEMKRLVTRKEVPGTDQQRVKGAEVMWQGELADIITGSIALNFTLPATSSKIHFRTSDDSLRVRFGSGVGKSLSVDFWFDLTEEIVKDDY